MKSRELREIIRKEIRFILSEEQNIPKVGDWFEDSETYELYPITYVDRKKRNFTIRRKGVNLAIDFWNVKPGGTKSGRKIWK